MTDEQIAELERRLNPQELAGIEMLKERLRALEEAARDLLDSMLEVTADAMGILPERKRLAEVLEGKSSNPIQSSSKT